MSDDDQARDVYMSRVQEEAHYFMLSTGTMPRKERKPIRRRKLTARKTAVRSIFSKPERNASSLEYDSEDLEIEAAAQGKGARYIAATDFGATYTAISLLRVDENGNADPNIIPISNYPDDPRTVMGESSIQVPTQIGYCDNDLEEQLSVEPDSRTYDALLQSDSDEYQVSKSRWYKSKLRETKKNQKTTICGFEVQNKLNPEMDSAKVNLISGFKLLLDRSEDTKSEREYICNTMEQLQLRKLIAKDENIIATFLTHLFLHAKQQSRDVHWIPASACIEHALSVPILWDAYSRLLFQNAIQIAIEASGFGTMENLFFVSEPEGALTYVLLSSSDYRPGDKVLNLDLGGITVDAGIFEVKHDFPLRLGDEPLVTPKGPLHGSSFLNSDFRKHLEKRLEDDIEPVERNGRKFQDVLDESTWEFERNIKRNVDFYKPLPLRYIKADGIKKDRTKRFIDNNVILERSDLYDIFEPRLTGIRALIRQQHIAAKQKEHIVDKVVMTGGFSTSESIRGLVRIVLKQISAEFGYTVALMNDGNNTVPPDYMSRGVAHRAYQKYGGPLRISELSYGFEIMETYDPEVFEAHRGITPHVDETDGCKYVQNVLDWPLTKGIELGEHAEYPVLLYHYFNVRKKTVTFEETLYVSNTCTESHYSKNHEMNRGKFQVAGVISVDMTPLATSGKLEIVKNKKTRQSFYVVEFDLVIIVNSRGLTYEARYPRKSKVSWGQSQTCIAAAFRPGTM